MPPNGGETRWMWRWIFWLADLDPKKSVFFRQSDVPEVTELTWMLGTVTPMGLLERCHSYKDKVVERDFLESLPCLPTPC